jgi:hypothetical protein
MIGRVLAKAAKHPSMGDGHGRHFQIQEKAASRSSAHELSQAVKFPRQLHQSTPQLGWMDGSDGWEMPSVRLRTRNRKDIDRIARAETKSCEALTLICENSKWRPRDATEFPCICLFAVQHYSGKMEYWPSKNRCLLCTVSVDSKRMQGSEVRADLCHTRLSTAQTTPILHGSSGYLIRCDALMGSTALTTETGGRLA